MGETREGENMRALLRKCCPHHHLLTEENTGMPASPGASFTEVIRDMVGEVKGGVRVEVGGVTCGEYEVLQAAVEGLEVRGGRVEAAVLGKEAEYSCLDQVEGQEGMVAMLCGDQEGVGRGRG